MTDPSRSFGILIAYILPGFVVLWAMAQQFAVVKLWLAGPDAATPVIGGVVYAAGASIIVGMTLNAARWLIIDPIHHFSGVHKPEIDDSKLQTNLEAFNRLVEDHFRYHQFYANTALAILIGHPVWRVSESGKDLSYLTDLGVVGLVLILGLSSRDALARYYSRSEKLLG